MSATDFQRLQPKNKGKKEGMKEEERERGNENMESTRKQI